MSKKPPTYSEVRIRQLAKQKGVRASKPRVDGSPADLWYFVDDAKKEILSPMTGFTTAQALKWIRQKAE